MELHDISAAKALSFAVDRLLRIHPDMTKAQAKKLVYNAVLYNVVMDEIMGQVSFLMGEDV